MEALFIILLIVLAGLALLVVPRWHLRRVIPQVIQSSGINPVCNLKTTLHQCSPLLLRDVGKKYSLTTLKGIKPFRRIFMPLDFDYRASFLLGFLVRPVEGFY